MTVTEQTPAVAADFFHPVWCRYRTPSSGGAEPDNEHVSEGYSADALDIDNAAISAELLQWYMRNQEGIITEYSSIGVRLSIVLRETSQAPVAVILSLTEVQRLQRALNLVEREMQFALDELASGTPNQPGWAKPETR